MDRGVEHADHLTVGVYRVGYDHSALQAVGVALQDARLAVSGGAVEHRSLAGVEGAGDRVRDLWREDGLAEDRLYPAWRDCLPAGLLRPHHLSVLLRRHRHGSGVAGTLQRLGGPGGAALGEAIAVVAGEEV